MAGTLLVVIVAMVPLLPEATTKPLFFFYGDSYEDLPTDYIQYPNDDSDDYYGDEKEDTPPRPAGGGGIINNGVVVTINGIPFNCTQKACVLNSNDKGEGGNGSPSKESPSPQDKETMPPSNSDTVTASENETTKAPASKETGNVSTEGTATVAMTEKSVATSA